MTESESVALPLGDAASTVIIIAKLLLFVNSYLQKKDVIFDKTKKRLFTLNFRLDYLQNPIAVI